MKKIHFIAFLSFGMLLNMAFGQEISKEQIAFVNKFIAAVEAHDQDAVLSMTDKNYRKEQLKFLEGRKEQFINELFGGVDIMNEDYINTKFLDILKIEVAEIVPKENGNSEYVFLIRAGHHELLKSLLLKKSKNKFGFIGAMG